MAKDKYEIDTNADYQKEFGKRLKKARENGGFSSASAFARALKIEVATYRYYERGQREPPFSLFPEICRLTGASTDYLILAKGPLRKRGE